MTTELLEGLRELSYKDPSSAAEGFMSEVIREGLDGTAVERLLHTMSEMLWELRAYSHVQVIDEATRVREGVHG